MALAEPPDLTVENYTDKVDKPQKWSTNEKNDRNNNSYVVLCLYASEKSVNIPYDIECGNAKNNLHDPGKIVKCLNKILHI